MYVFFFFFFKNVMHKINLHTKPNGSQELAVSVSHKMNCLFKIRTVSWLPVFLPLRYFSINFYSFCGVMVNSSLWSEYLTLLILSALICNLLNMAIFCTWCNYELIHSYNFPKIDPKFCSRSELFYRYRKDKSYGKCFS